MVGAVGGIGLPGLFHLRDGTGDLVRCLHGLGGGRSGQRTGGSGRWTFGLTPFKIKNKPCTKLTLVIGLVIAWLLRQYKIVTTGYESLFHCFIGGS